MDIAFYTCRGGRSINEDSYFAGEQVFVVADGLGGHAKGEVASARAVECVRRYCDGGYSYKKINKILNAANKAVCDLNSPARTTIAIAFLENGMFRYANVGDSRVYYFRKGKIIAQTRDHSVSQVEVDMGILKPEDIRQSENRSRLLKALGGSDGLNIKNNYPQIEILPGDAFLICSDGFWEYVYENEMETDLLQTETSENWISCMLKRHLSRSEDKGDNYTVICVRADKQTNRGEISPQSFWGSVKERINKMRGGQKHGNQ